MYIIEKFIIRFFLCSIFFLSAHAACQDNQLKEIDNLLKKSEKSNQKLETLKQLQFAKEASVLAEKAKDSKRISESYCQIASALSRLELQKQSLSYIEKAEAQPYTKQNTFLQARLIQIKSTNYNTLQLSSQSRRELLKTIQLLDNQKDSLSIKLLASTYGNLGNRYTDKNILDSALFYYRREKQELKKVPEKQVIHNLSEHYISVGVIFLQKKQSDSALYYFEKSYQLKKKYNYKALFLEYFVFGDYYFAQKQYSKALDFYLKSLNSPGFPQNHSGFIHIYKKIAELYGILGNESLKDQYQKIYIDKQKQILKQNNKNVEYALNVILKDRDEENIKDERINYIWIFSAIFLLVFIFLIIYSFLRKKLRHKETFITEVNNTLQEKEKLISQKHIEAEELQLKMNDAYSEVIELAKNNSPSFYFRFQEVYPEFQKKILEISPTLKTSELILCAYTFLGFTIKDIANYTFKSANTIRNRKQSLRKKFNIPTEQDMGNWLQNLIEK